MKKLLLFAVVIAAMLAAACSKYKYETVAGDPLNTRIYTLDNGLKVYMSVNKEAPRIQTYIAVKVGGKNDPAETTGLAHYFEHLMFKGTEKFGTSDYAAEKPMLDEIERLFEVYRKTCPAYIEDISEIHRTEPYVYSQMVAGKDAPTFGEAKNSWLTGTAAWTFFNISQYILGIQPTLDGLKVDPCIPHTLSGFTVTRRFRGAVYHITVDNAAGVQHGIKAVTVDGKAISGNVLPLAAAGTEVTVQVTMG